MNGRVYDPNLGRFISPDPFVQAPDNSQSLNRYSYVLNNPLSYSDPSGFFFKKLFSNKIFRFAASIALVALTYNIVSGSIWASALAGGPITAAQAAATGFIAKVAGGAAAGFVGGFVGSGGDFGAAFQGAVFGGITGGIAAQGWSRPIAAIAHGVVGGVRATINGGKFLRGFVSSYFTKRFASGPIKEFFGGGKIAGAIANAVVGGTASALGGGKFANGAYTNAFQYLLNEVGDILTLKLKLGAHITGRLSVFSGSVKANAEADIASANYEWTFGKDGWRFEKKGSQGVDLGAKAGPLEVEASIEREHSSPGNDWEPWQPKLDGSYKTVPLDGKYEFQAGVLIAPGFELNLIELKKQYGR